MPKRPEITSLILVAVLAATIIALLPFGRGSLMVLSEDFGLILVGAILAAAAAVSVVHLHTLASNEFERPPQNRGRH